MAGALISLKILMYPILTDISVSLIPLSVSLIITAMFLSSMAAGVLQVQISQELMRPLTSSMTLLELILQEIFRIFLMTLKMN